MYLPMHTQCEGSGGGKRKKKKTSKKWSRTVRCAERGKNFAVLGTYWAIRNSYWMIHDSSSMPAVAERPICHAPPNMS
jgi:hypothetical protein